MRTIAISIGLTFELIENRFLACRSQHEHSSGVIGSAGSGCSVEIAFCVADEIIAPGPTTITATLKVPHHFFRACPCGQGQRQYHCEYRDKSFHRTPSSLLSGM